MKNERSVENVRNICRIWNCGKCRGNGADVENMEHVKNVDYIGYVVHVQYLSNTRYARNTVYLSGKYGKCMTCARSGGCSVPIWDV